MDRREYKQMMEQIRPAPELMERVLAEGQTERSRPMKHRIRAAGVAALAAALLMGTALAVNSGFLERYFKGDLSVVEPYIQGGESVSDGKFRLTLDSAVVDQYGLVAQVTLEALTDEGAAWLMEGAQMSPWERYDAPESTFDPGDVWLASADYAGEQLSWRYCNASPKLEGEHSYSFWEDISLRTDRSVTTQLRVEFDPNEMEEGLDTLWIGVDCMGPKYAIRLPEVGSMGAVTVEPECKILLNPEWDRSATVHLLEFGPLSSKLVYSYGEWEESWDTFLQGEFFLKLKDGTIYTPGDLKAGWGTRPEYDDAPEGQRTITETTIGFFDRVVDLDQVESVILGDLEYPVDSSGPVPAELDESLRPFVLYYPGWSADDQVPAAELCSRLGAGCHWDREAGTVTITYRGHTAVLTVGTEELVVDGAEEMTFGPTVERDGQVYLNWKVCDYLEIPCQSMTYALRIMPPGLK